MTKVIDFAPLMEAAVASIVSHKTATDTYEKMVMFAKGMCAEDFDNSIVCVEEQVKKDYSITQMPSAWRSAKSVVRCALALSVKLLDEEGKVRGKTAVEKSNKAVLATAVGVPKNEVADNILRKTNQLDMLVPLAAFTMSEAQKEAIIVSLDSIKERIKLHAVPF